MHFEELEVGQSFVTDPQQVTDEMSVDNPALAAFMAAELWRASRAGRRLVTAGGGHVGASWRSGRRLQAGETVRLHSTVIRLEPDATAGAGDVTCWDELHDAEGDVVYAGTSTHRVRADDLSAHRPHRDVGTRAWGAALAEHLEADAAFTAAVAAWDGSLGVRGGRHEIHFRIYRGRIIEVTPKSPHGATFTFGASDRVWADLLTASEARFGARLMSGEFEVTGNPYEYLRLTKALELLVDGARALAAATEAEAA